jgi:hypothetical protein
LENDRVREKWVKREIVNGAKRKGRERNELSGFMLVYSRKGQGRGMRRGIRAQPHTNILNEEENE